MPLREVKWSGNKWSGPLAEKLLVKGQELKGWDSMSGSHRNRVSPMGLQRHLYCVLKNHLKKGIMKSKVTNCYIGAFYMKNPVLCSLVLQ